MNRFNLTAISAGFCLALSTGAFALNTPHAMAKPDYKAAKDQISAKYKDDKATCKPMTGNAKDICMEEAKGREKIAKAELEAKYEPSVNHDRDVRLAKADAAFAVAKEKCDDQKGNAKDVCVKEAKAAHVSAKADAKAVQKTADAQTTAHEKIASASTKATEKTANARKDAAEDKRDAAYSVAKEKCDALSGDAKSNCIKNAKARYGQS